MNARAKETNAPRRSVTLVLDVLDVGFPDQYRAARSRGINVLVDPFSLVYRLGWDKDQAFLLSVLEEVCADMKLSELRDDEDFDLLGRYLLDAAYGSFRRGRGNKTVLEPSTVAWFVEQGCSLQTRYTDRQVTSYQGQLTGRVFRSNNTTGRCAFAIIASSRALPEEDPWLHSVRAGSADV